MEFGIFSNGFRPHTTAAATYEEDIFEIVLADELGFGEVYISEHHGERPYINRVDTIPVPELMMCKAAALTRRIRFAAAVKLIHLQHPVDTAIQAAVTDHVIGGGRFIFGFGTGFPQPLFCEERGLSFEDRHARLRESLDLILKCWESDEPFDWEGEHWQARNVVALPKPLSAPMPMATATETEDSIRLAGERGYTLLSGFIESPASLRRKGETYARAGLAAGRTAPLDGIAASRMIYVAGSRQEALADLRPAVTYEVSVQAERGFLRMLKNVFGFDVPNDDNALDAMVEAGIYVLGDAEEVAEGLKELYDDAGGFGTLLYVAGKDWADRERRARSMRLFMEQVAPQLRGLRTRTPAGLAVGG